MMYTKMFRGKGRYKQTSKHYAYEGTINNMTALYKWYMVVALGILDYQIVVSACLSIIILLLSLRFLRAGESFHPAEWLSWNSVAMKAIGLSVAHT